MKHVWQRLLVAALLVATSIIGGVLLSSPLTDDALLASDLLPELDRPYEPGDVLPDEFAKQLVDDHNVRFDHTSARTIGRVSGATAFAGTDVETGNICFGLYAKPATTPPIAESIVGQPAEWAASMTCVSLEFFTERGIFLTLTNEDNETRALLAPDSLGQIADSLGTQVAPNLYEVEASDDQLADALIRDPREIAS